MIKDLERIRQHSADIWGSYPEQRAELARKLAEAEENKRKAKAALDAAEDLDSYDNAAEILKRAELATKFARGALDKLDAAPRMKEAEYMQTINTCRGIMDNATSTYRTKTAALMDQLKAVHDEYTQTAADVNNTLVELDLAANVLQSKYPYKVRHFKDLPDKKEPSKTAWLDYALRYEPATACTRATACTAEDKAENPHHAHDSLLTAAWQAVNKAYPRKSF